MTNVINNIVSNIIIQHALVEFLQITNTVDENITICKDVYLSGRIPANRHLLEDVFMSVTPFNVDGVQYYQIAKPRKEYMTAIRYCADNNLLNKWIKYFCIGKVKNDTQIMTSYERTKLQLQIDCATNIQDNDWEKFIEYLRASTFQNCKCNIAISGFTLDELKHDPYLALMAKEFSEIYLVIQRFPCKGREIDLKVLEINHTVYDK